MANSTIKVNDEVTFEAEIDATTYDDIVTAIGLNSGSTLSEKYFALIVENVNTGKTWITRGHTANGDSDNTVVYDDGNHTNAPYQNGLIKIKHKFSEEGRFNVKLCMIKDKNSWPADDDNVDTTMDKMMDDEYIAVLKTIITVVPAQTVYEFEDKITGTLVSEKA